MVRGFRRPDLTGDAHLSGKLDRAKTSQSQGEESELAKTRAFEQKHYLLEVRLRREEIDSFADYPFCLAAVRHLTTLTLHPAVTFIIGENGTGKSTLLEAIAVAHGFNPEGGTRNFNFATRASHSSLHKFLRLSRGIRRARDGYFLRAESFYNVATEIERLGVGDSYGDASLHEQSHGESFMSLITHRFGGHGLYLLDEPEAALSPTRQMALITRIHDLVVNHSQFIIATHSPIIMAYPDARIFHLSDQGIEEVAYTDTEHYQVSRSFLTKHEHMLRILMEK
jgi:predicted ATPase